MTYSQKILVCSSLAILFLVSIGFIVLKYKNTNLTINEQEKNLINMEAEDNSEVVDESSNTIDTSNWKMYLNEKSMFKIYYPKHWSVYEFVEENIFNLPRIALESKSGALISLYPKGGYDRGIPFIISEEYITVNNQTATKYDFGLRSDGRHMLIVNNIKNWWPDNRILFLSSTSTEHHVYELEEFEAILSTFRILEEKM